MIFMKSNINSMYRHHNSFKIFQGDILKNVKLNIEYDDNPVNSNDFTVPYIVIMSQDCDLDNDFKSYQAYSKFSLKNDLKSSNFDDFSSDQKNQLRSMYDKLLPSVLICPAFLASEFREGIHLRGYDNYHMQYINSKNWNTLKHNETPRYHFLRGDADFQFPDLVIDFKWYYTFPTGYMYSIFEDSYAGSLNELYRERMSQRFVNYLSRIGLP